MRSRNRGLPCGAGVDICTDGESLDWEVFQAWGLVPGYSFPLSCITWAHTHLCVMSHGTHMGHMGLGG
jgi:hypothetical protein